MKPRIAIIGAGMAGLTLARMLHEKAEVTVFEKARGVGGRMSTRYAEPFYFDHGTQFFTARSEAFKAFLAPHIADGTVAEWRGKVITLAAGKTPGKRLWFEPHWVATPNMNSLCKKLASGLTIHLSTEIAPLDERVAGEWILKHQGGTVLGGFDWVISTAPPAQTRRLFSAHFTEENTLPAVALKGCYSVMLGFAKPWQHSWIAAKISDSPLEWLAVSSSKPGRNTNVTSLVLHSQHDWAEAHIDEDVTDIQALLLAEFDRITGIDSSAADYVTTHRWKYAIVEHQERQPEYCDHVRKLAATGDWPTASRIEDTWLNATALARILNI